MSCSRPSPLAASQTTSISAKVAATARGGGGGQGGGRGPGGGEGRGGEDVAPRCSCRYYAAPLPPLGYRPRLILSDVGGGGGGGGDANVPLARGQLLALNLTRGAVATSRTVRGWPRSTNWPPTPPARFTLTSMTTRPSLAPPVQGRRSDGGDGVTPPPHPPPSSTSTKTLRPGDPRRRRWTPPERGKAARMRVASGAAQGLRP